MTIPGVTFHPRHEWQDPAKPVSGPYPYKAGQVWTAVLHYTAALNLPDGDPGESTDIGAYLRQIQASYINGRGYSLGYSFAVDYLGGVWEIRGFDWRPAANNGDFGEYKDINFNAYSLPILCLVDGADRLTDAAAHAVKQVQAEGWRRTKQAGGSWRSFSPQRHSDSDWTACPGDGIGRDIDEGRVTFSPYTPPPAIEEGDMFPIDPVRSSDTRKFGVKLPVGWHTFKLPDVVPVDASAVFVNLTAVEGDGPGYVAVGPPHKAAGVPSWSSLNFGKNQTIANTTVSKVKDRHMSVYVRTPCHLIVDVLGFVR